MGVHEILPVFCARFVQFWYS